MENYKMQHLLDNVSIISKKYEDIAKESGDNFNIFSIMNMEFNEVYTHSAIIGELLNPEGSHGQGAVFLNYFIDILNKKFDIKIEEFKTLVNDKICERTISSYNDWEQVSGGRIDIVIEDNEQILLIENKVYAKNQEYQLIRYYNYAKLRNKDFFIIYLTLDEQVLNDEKPYLICEPTITGKNFHYSKKEEYEIFKKENVNPNNHYCLYYPITYKNVIVEWMEKCTDIIDLNPIIKETIKQYLKLIKKLTNQTINNKMSEDIVNEMAKSVKSSFEIQNNIENLKKNLYSNFKNLIKDVDIAKSALIEIDDVSVEYEMYLTPSSWKDKSIQISIVFHKTNVAEWYYGISNLDKIFPIAIKQELIKKFGNYGYDSNQYNIWKIPTINKKNNNAEVWEDIAKGLDSEIFKEITDGIVQIIEIEKSINL